MSRQVLIFSGTVLYGLALVFTVIVGLVLVAARQADERDRSPYLWGGLTAAAAVGAAMVSWRWLAGGVEALDSGGSMVAAGFALIVGPIAAPTLVIAGLRRLPPGRPRILAPVAVRMSGSGGEVLHLHIGDEELRLIAAEVETRIARVELAHIEADGECLRLTLRDGQDLRLQVIEHDDPYRRRRTCEALAAALAGPAAQARLRRG